MDLSFSLRDWEKDAQGNFIVNQRMVDKACRLYPWLLRAFRDQVPARKTAEAFWTEFLSYIQTHRTSGVVELKGLEGSTFSSYHTHWEGQRDKRRKTRSAADVIALSSEVGDAAAYHAETLSLHRRQKGDGYGVVGMDTGFQAQSSAASTKYSRTSKI